MSNQAVTARQWPLSFFVALANANFGVGNGYTVTLPPNAYLESLKAFIATVSDAGTTATITVSDGTNTFINAQSVKSTGLMTVAIPNHFFPSGATLTISLAQTGTPSTVLAGYVSGSYLVSTRETEQQF